MPAISDDEIWEFLHSIELGRITLEVEGLIEPQEIYAGNVAYGASNGWRIVVFNDANEWDYIDEIVAGDGRRIVFDEIYTSYPDVSNYSPSQEISLSKYQIPGSMRFWCFECESHFKTFHALKQHRLGC